MGKVRFEVILLEEAERFLGEIDPKAERKLLGHLRRAQTHIDPKIFKKLDDVLWEFRVEYNRLQYRLLAFGIGEMGNWHLWWPLMGLSRKQIKLPEGNLKELTEYDQTIMKEKKSKKKKLKVYTLDEVLDSHIGKRGTMEREKFEFEVQLAQIGDAIRVLRKSRKLTQEQLGDLIGVQKAQISKLESNAGNITLETVLRVFAALKADISFNIHNT